MAKARKFGFSLVLFNVGPFIFVAIITEQSSFGYRYNTSMQKSSIDVSMFLYKNLALFYNSCNASYIPKVYQSWIKSFV